MVLHIGITLLMRKCRTIGAPLIRSGEKVDIRNAKGGFFVTKELQTTGWVNICLIGGASGISK